MNERSENLYFGLMDKGGMYRAAWAAWILLTLVVGSLPLLRVNETHYLFRPNTLSERGAKF